MTLRDLAARYLPEDNVYYARFYPLLFITLNLLFLLILVGAGVTWYLVTHRPTPFFLALQQNGEKRVIYGARDPNLLPATIIRFATQAAVRAYNFSPVNNESNLQAVRWYFTDNGWSNYIESVAPLVQRVETDKLFAYGIVNGTPLISNQGDLSGLGYAWRVQIPFLVTFMSAEEKTQQDYMVLVTIVKVPTYISPQGIGIEQFIMVNLNATI